MKKAILAILFIVPVLFTSCSNDEPKEGENPLAGTKWVNITPHPQEHIEFYYLTFDETHIEREFVYIWEDTESKKWKSPYTFIAPDRITFPDNSKEYKYARKHIIIPMPDFETEIIFERVNE